MPALTTLGQIRTKIRRLTRSVSEAQLTTDQIDEYIDTFVLYDLPANIKLDYLSKTLTWWTQPNIDSYETDTLNVPELVDFKNKYICMDQPVYVNGNKIMYTQSRDQFYNMYPMVTPLINQQMSNGTNTYTGTLTTIPVLRNNVTFSMSNAAGVGFEVHDNGLGVLVGDTPGGGTIDYLTGAYTVIFNDIPAPLTFVQSAVYAYTAGQPDTMLFYETKFILRPVPIAVYKVTLNAYLRPTAFFDMPTVIDPSFKEPELKEWAQYIAIGAARKVYEDRFDMESSNALMPIFKEQETLCLRRKILQQRDQRSRTIFNESNASGYWWNRWI
jgi:hypothetical protein